MYRTRILTVVHGKGEKMRHIPMVGELVEVLENVPRHISEKGASPYVFNNSATGTRWVDIRKPWDQALASAGITGFRFHNLRHTFPSRLVQRGVPLKAVQELLGHADIKMTMRYAHLSQGDLRKAVETLSAVGQAALAGDPGVQIGTREAQAPVQAQAASRPRSNSGGLHANPLTARDYRGSKNPATHKRA